MNDNPVITTPKKDKTEYRKKYYAENKEFIFQKIKCEICGHEYKRCNKSQHLKTRKHNDAVLKKQNELLAKELEDIKSKSLDKNKDIKKELGELKFEIMDLKNQILEK